MSRGFAGIMGLLFYSLIITETFGTGENQLTKYLVTIPPPAPTNSKAHLRADQILQLNQERGLKVNKTKFESTTSNEVTNSKIVITRKNTGLKIKTIPDTNNNRFIKVQADQVLVRFKPGITKVQQSQSLIRHQTMLIERKTSLLEKIGYQRIRIPETVLVEKILSDLKHDEAIEQTEANIILISNGEKPSDSIFNPKWGIDAIHVSQAWEITQGDPSVIVAVVDSGIDGDHTDLVGKTVPGFNFITENYETKDDYGHGTQIAGIIAASYNTATGTVGVAPRSRLMPLKVLDANGEGTVADVAEAIIYAADSGLRVIILALGTYTKSGILQSAIEYANHNNCLIISAAGNNGTDEPAYPAAYPQTLAVGALDPLLKPCFFSNHASYIDVVAPGTNILATAIEGGHQEITGTSAAAAHVAGLAALLLASQPSLDPETFQAIVRDSAADLMAQGWDQETGFGLVDCFAALNQSSASSMNIGIVDIITSPSRPRPGQIVSIILTIRNHGVQSVRNANIVISRDDQTIASANIPQLAPKDTFEFSFQWAPLQNDAEATALLAAKLVPLPMETSIVDNFHEIPIFVTNTIHHDVAILNACPIGAPLFSGETIPIQVTIINFSNVSIANVHLETSWLDNSEFYNLVFAPGERQTILTKCSLPDEPNEPDKVTQAYILTFIIEGINNDEYIENNLLQLRMDKLIENNHFIPFHTTGDSYSDNKYVHQWIANEAYKYFNSQVEGSELGSYLGTISGSFIVDNSDLLEGTFAEDLV